LVPASEKRGLNWSWIRDRECMKTEVTVLDGT
jgi:hypothetical protein